MTPSHFFEIAIDGISVYACHGVNPEEKVNEQEFRVDILLTIVRVSDADNLETTLNYLHVAQKIFEYARSESFDLIETLALRLAEQLIDEELVVRARVTVHKPSVDLGVPISDLKVSVELNK